jgi:hypothetical protein
MPTITISSGTTTVNSPISGDTSYIVEGSGTLDVVNDGTVSGLITISSGGISGATVNVSSGGTTLDTMIDVNGFQYVFWRRRGHQHNDQQRGLSDR